MAKFLSDAIVREILARTGAADGDIIFFGADSKKVVCDAMGALRLKVGRDLGLLEKAGSRCGSSTSRCSKRMAKAVWLPCTTRSPRRAA